MLSAAPLALAAALRAAPAHDTTAPPLAAPRPAAAAPPRDTTRPRAIDVPSAYDRRLAIHRWGSYAMLPLFGARYVLGERVLRQKTDLREGRRVDAIGSVGLATVSGVMMYVVNRR